VLYSCVYVQSSVLYMGRHKRYWVFQAILRNKLSPELGLIFGSVYGFNCSNIEKMDLDWALSSFSITCTFFNDSQWVRGRFLLTNDRQSSELDWLQGGNLRAGSGQGPEVKFTFIEGLKASAQGARELMGVKGLKSREKKRKQTFKMFNECNFVFGVAYGHVKQAFI
jgi:hypothetical protein